MNKVVRREGGVLIPFFTTGETTLGALVTEVRLEDTEDPLAIAETLKRWPAVLNKGVKGEGGKLPSTNFHRIDVVLHPLLPTPYLQPWTQRPICTSPGNGACVFLARVVGFSRPTTWGAWWRSQTPPITPTFFLLPHANTFPPAPRPFHSPTPTFFPLPRLDTILLQLSAALGPSV